MDLEPHPSPTRRYRTLGSQTLDKRGAVLGFGSSRDGRGRREEGEVLRSLFSRTVVLTVNESVFFFFVSLNNEF